MPRPGRQRAPVSAATTLSVPALAARIVGAVTPGQCLIVAITGSVASGKSTLAAALAEHLPQPAAIVSSDGFLLPNNVLEARGLLLRKGFPESYDHAGFRAALTGLRQGAADVPGYSHSSFDIDPALARRIEGAAVVIVEGLGFNAGPAGATPADDIDLLLYLHAAEADLERWYVERFLGFWRAAASDPASFYTRFLALDEAGVTAVARSVWADINLPNLREHIAPLRGRADLVVRKAADHGLFLV